MKSLPYRLWLTHWRQLQDHLAAYAYDTPWFVLRTTVQSLSRHNVMGLSAALSFYALFALIPLIVLIFFLISHLVYTSDYAIVKLAILTSNLLPEFSQRIMVEVYHNTQTQAAWGMLGFLLLLWTITPLAAHLRSSFYLIACQQDVPSFWRKKFRDVMAVLGVLLVFFLFTAAGFVLESVILFLAHLLPATLITLVGNVLSLLLTTVLIAGFYRTFCPLHIHWRHLLISALVTAGLWLLMRPAFGLFLTFNQNYGAIFGSMKAMFISISWLYLNFAVFLIGFELMVTLRRKEMLLLKGLFDDAPNHHHYLQALTSKYGKRYAQDSLILQQGDRHDDYYMVVDGTVHLCLTLADGSQHTLRRLQHGDFFGEHRLFPSLPAGASAKAASSQVTVIVIPQDYMTQLLQEDPQIALKILRQLSQHQPFRQAANLLAI